MKDRCCCGCCFFPPGARCLLFAIGVISTLFPTLSVLSMITVLLLLFVVVWSDPFVRIFPPAIEGRDLNPTLQTILGYPPPVPLLYSGYGGLMVAAGGAGLAAT